MNQYLMSVHSVEGDAPPSAEVMQAMFRDVDVFNQKVRDAGAWVFAGGLQPAEEAKVVHAKDGEVLTTDGPFPEAKEQLGGFWVIKASDLEAALAWAAEASVACRSPVEVRPFQDPADED